MKESKQTSSSDVPQPPPLKPGQVGQPPSPQPSPLSPDELEREREAQEEARRRQHEHDVQHQRDQVPERRDVRPGGGGTKPRE
jgi:hypothetical protein